MTERVWRTLRLSLLWGVYLACMIALICGVGMRFWPAAAGLVIFGGFTGTLAAFEHGWHRSRAGFISLLRVLILLVLIWVPLAVVGWPAWPRPAQLAVSPAPPVPKSASAQPDARNPVPSPPGTSGAVPTALPPIPEFQNPPAPFAQSDSDPLTGQALAAIQRCYFFQQQTEKRRDAAWQNIKAYVANPNESEENKRDYVRRIQSSVNEEDERQYTQHYKDEFTRVIHELISAGAREQSPGMNLENIGFEGGPASVCSDLRGTTWSYVDDRFHRGNLTAAEVRQFIAQLRRIERQYPSLPAPGQ